MFIQIKPDASTQHAQFVLVSNYRLSVRLSNPVGSSGAQVQRRRSLGDYAEDRRMGVLSIATVNRK